MAWRGLACFDMRCCQIASLRFCHGYTPWARWQKPKGCIHSKSVAVAASADSFELSSQVGCCRSLQGSGGWWLVIALVGCFLEEAAAMTVKIQARIGGGALRIVGRCTGRWYGWHARFERGISQTVTVLRECRACCAFAGGRHGGRQGQGREGLGHAVDGVRGVWLPPERPARAGRGAGGRRQGRVGAGRALVGLRSGN